MICTVETASDMVPMVGLGQWNLDERLIAAIQQGNDPQEQVGEWLEKQLAIAQLILMNAATVPALRQEVEKSLRDLAIQTTRRSPFLSR